MRGGRHCHGCHRPVSSFAARCAYGCCMAGIREPADSQPNRTIAAGGSAQTGIGAIMTLDRFIETVRTSGLFDRDADVFVARAPGRLDVMGGIADYSGSLVLQRPTAEATWAAFQPTDQRGIQVVSLGDLQRSATLEFGTPIEYQRARELYTAHAALRWTAYIAGVFLVLV